MRDNFRWQFGAWNAVEYTHTHTRQKVTCTHELCTKLTGDKCARPLVDEGAHSHKFHDHRGVPGPSRGIVDAEQKFQAELANISCGERI